MALSNYGELKDTIADWLLRSDLTAKIPDFIRLAEGSLNRRLRHWRQITRKETTVSQRFLGLPADYLEAIALQIERNGRIYVLEPLTITQNDRMRLRSEAAGRPRFFAHFGGSIELLPTPDGSYPLELTFYAGLESMEQDGDCNWLLAFHPDVYLYGALLQSAPYLHEDERLATWGTLYTEALDELHKDGERGEFSGGTLTMRTRPERVIGG